MHSRLASRACFSVPSLSLPAQVFHCYALVHPTNQFLIRSERHSHRLRLPLSAFAPATRHSFRSYLPAKYSVAGRTCKALRHELVDDPENPRFGNSKLLTCASPRKLPQPAADLVASLSSPACAAALFTAVPDRTQQMSFVDYA